MQPSGPAPPSMAWDRAADQRVVVIATSWCASGALSVTRLSELAQRLPLLVQRHVRVDRHRDLDIRVADDLPDDVRRRSKIEQKRDAGQR